jgi:rSAM/selenodomain-associated transferase 1
MAAHANRARRPKSIALHASTARTCGIAVMAKASAPGRTKTRLVPPLTFEEAADFNTAFLQDIAANLLALGRRSAIQPYMAFGPPGSTAFFHRALPDEVGLIEAWSGDFGACLLAAMRGLLARGHDSAIVLNSDSPTLPASLLFEAVEVLALPGDRAVLGPAADGGYYLLGLKHPHFRLFEDIDWSTDRVAQQTAARAHEIGLPVHRLPPWYDCDDAAALRTLYAELYRGHSFVPGLKPGHAAYTAALMDRLAVESDFPARIGITGPFSERVAV